MRFRYIKGDDPADWVTVDPVTGKVTTKNRVDRESHFVKDGIYTVTVLAVDNGRRTFYILYMLKFLLIKTQLILLCLSPGKPPMTGTATLSIAVNDENDNTPSMAVSTVDMCQSDGPSLVNISASDPDGEPYGGPFQFKLLGDVKGKWKFAPEQGEHEFLLDFKAKLMNAMSLLSNHPPSSGVGNTHGALQPL